MPFAPEELFSFGRDAFQELPLRFLLDSVGNPVDIPREDHRDEHAVKQQKGNAKQDYEKCRNGVRAVRQAPPEAHVKR